jgi:hypothetical protein
MGIKEVFVYLENLGFLNVVVPFIIIFIVLYALLKRVKLFKDNRVNVILATLISFIAIAAADVVTSINLFSYYLVIFIFVIISILILISLLGGELDFMSKGNKKYFTWAVAVIMCLLIIYALYRSGIKLNLGPISYDWLRSIIPIAIAILVFILVIWFITSGDQKTDKERAKERRESTPRLPIISDINKRANQILKLPSREQSQIRLTQEQINQLKDKTTEEQIKLLNDWGY